MPGAAFRTLGEAGDWVQTDWMSNALRYATRAHLRRLELLYGQPVDCGAALAEGSGRTLQIVAVTGGWLVQLTVTQQAIESAAARLAELVAVTLHEHEDGALRLSAGTRGGGAWAWEAADRSACDALFAFADGLHRCLARA
ncbi:MAG: hypothetical protein FJ035_07940 [Chloroflexi bacterium]|nr:hypothetical protein [Chloroflexota bacterium]